MAVAARAQRRAALPTARAVRRDVFLGHLLRAQQAVTRYWTYNSLLMRPLACSGVQTLGRDSLDIRHL